MHAAVFEQFGEPGEVLSVREIDLRQPRPGEVRVRMLASPINPSDLLTVRGQYGKLPKLPATPGYEGVGIVEKNGGGILGRLLLGRRVAVLNAATGSWGEQAIVGQRQAIPLPGTLSVEQAATFFINPATALILTRHLLQIPKGAWLLQTAAGSALGQMVIRLGKHFGFRTLNIVRRPEQVDALRQLGADVVLVGSDENLVPQVLEATHGMGVKYAIDAVGGKLGSVLIDCLAQRGRLVVYGTLTDEPLSFSSRALMMRQAKVESFWLSLWMANLGLVNKLRLIRSLTGLVRSGVLQTEIGASFPLTRLREAVEAARQPARAGKVLLRLDAS